MSFPRYPEYKDSGQDWLGTIPSHWTVMPLAKIALGPGSLFIDGDWVESKDLADDGIRYITTGNVGEGRYKEQGSGYISQAKFDELRCTEVLPGDVLISRLNLPIGRACVVPDLGERIITSVDNVITRPDSGYSRAYLAYMLSSASHFANMEILARGTTMQRISRSTLGQVRFAFPTEEQTTIATFLDRETAKIDALVAEQEKLIGLLQEKRQAVISHAVTKGLDPNVPMKDSGVEWLGEVPGHWEPKRLKFLASNIKAGPFGSALTKDMYVGSGYRVYGQEQVIPGDFAIGDYYIDEAKFAELSQYETRTDDVLISCVGTFGKIAVVPADAAPGIINPRLIRLRTAKDVMPLFLAEVLRSTVTFEQFSVLSRGGTMDVINIGTLSDIWIALPPIAEQSAILNEITTQMARFDALMAQAQSAITLLQERRTALISAAVTGQIDVRGLAGGANAPDSIAASAYPASA